MAAATKAREPGTRRAEFWLVAFLVVLFLVVLLLKISPGSASTAPSDQKYGGLPSWLPTATVPVHDVLNASAVHPQLGIEGNTMRVTLRAGVIVVTMSGPAVPPFTTPPPPVTPATVTLSFAPQSGDVAIRARDFTFLDGNGVELRPQTFVGGKTSLTLRPGQQASVKITEVMAIGAGSIKWSPGGVGVAEWEFTVEND